MQKRKENAGIVIQHYLLLGDKYVVAYFRNSSALCVSKYAGTNASVIISIPQIFLLCEILTELDPALLAYRIPSAFCPSTDEGKKRYAGVVVTHTHHYKVKLTSEKLVLFASLNVLGPMPKSSSESCWCFFSVKWQATINKVKKMYYFT